MPKDLIPYEIDILRELNGEHVPGLAWGAAMSECIESLYEGGYVAQEMWGNTLTYVITDKGRAALSPSPITGEENE